MSHASSTLEETSNHAITAGSPLEWLRPVIGPYLVSRAVVLVTAFFLEWLLDSGRTYKYGFILQAPLAPLSATFDANWYASIAKYGYSVSADITQQQNYHFFPLYPMLMHASGTILGLADVQGGYNVAGVILSHIFLLASLVLFYRLTLKLSGDLSLARYSVWAIMILPWSFVFSMAYTEALFLLITLAAITLGLRSYSKPLFWSVFAAGLLTALAALTRPQGVILVVPMVLLLSVAPPMLTKAQRLMNAALIIVPAILAVAAFVALVGLWTGNPYALLQDNHTWGDGWLHDLSRLIVLPPANPMWVVDIVTTVGLVVWIVLLILLLRHVAIRRVAIAQRLDAGWAVVWALPIYASAYFLFTALTSPSNSSWGRYMLVVFPCVWVAAAVGQYLRKYLSARTLLPIALALQMLLFSSAIILQVTP